jgi:hypothetical protein
MSGDGMEDQTPRGYPLPHPDHLLSQDVLSLRDAITRIDADVSAQEAHAVQQQEHLSERLHRQQLRAFHHFDF